MKVVREMVTRFYEPAEVEYRPIEYLRAIARFTRTQLTVSSGAIFG